MAPDKLKPNDSRVEDRTATINGKTYHYLVANPAGASPPRATVLLVHGWPDLGFGWRYQVPFLQSLGLRVVVPDMLGYGRTDAPDSLAEYSMKRMSDDVVALAAQATGSETEPVILGGHDWGGALVWRVALWHPSRVRAVFSVCTPYAPPTEGYVPLEELVKKLPNFTYQLQLAGPEVEASVVGKDKLRQFINGLYGGRGPAGEPAFDVKKGVLLDNLDKIGQSPLLTPGETEFYVQEYARTGLRGPLNWYRTRKVNHDEELALLKGKDEGSTRIRLPSLFISAARDDALPPWMSTGMDAHFDSLVRKEVNANHWALVEAAEEVNSHIGAFVEHVLGKGEVKAKV